jgi:hypothetical protein
MAMPYVERFNYARIPANMLESLRRYIDHGVLPSHFLRAVLFNDLAGACARADDQNIELLPVYIAWLMNEAPATCWGSQAIVTAYVEQCRDRRAGEAATP